MSYSNMDNVPTQTAGTSELLASDWNTYVRDNFDSIKFGHVVVADASAKTALGNVAEGVMVYQADNQKVYVNRNGTTADWVEVSDLDNTGGVSDTVQGYLDDYAVQSRNVIINGAMQVAQRATSKTSITGNGYYTNDRFKTSIGSLGTWTQSVENDAPTGSGFRKSLKMLCTTADASPAAGDYTIINQLIEGQNLQHFRKGTSDAKKFALSFWVKSNKTGNYVVELFDADNTRHICALYNVSASGTWEKKTIVFPADTTGAFNNDNDTSLEVNFWLDSGSNYDSGTLPTSAWASNTDANRAAGGNSLGAATNNYWQVTGVQLEAGDYNTPFEFEPYETTLRKCQRYYHVLADSGETAAALIGIGAATQSFVVETFINLGVVMRGTPSLEATTGTNFYTFFRLGAADLFNSLTLTTSITTPRAVGMYNSSEIASTAGDSGTMHITSGNTAKVALNAEL